MVTRLQSAVCSIFRALSVVEDASQDSCYKNTVRDDTREELQSFQREPLTGSSIVFPFCFGGVDGGWAYKSA